MTRRQDYLRQSLPHTFLFKQNLLIPTESRSDMRVMSQTQLGESRGDGFTRGIDGESEVHAGPLFFDPKTTRRCLGLKLRQRNLNFGFDFWTKDVEFTP